MWETWQQFDKKKSINQSKFLFTGCKYEIKFYKVYINIKQMRKEFL